MSADFMILHKEKLHQEIITNDQQNQCTFLCASHCIQKITLEWLEDLNVRPRTMKLLKGNTWEMSLDTSVATFLDKIQKTQATKATIGKWDYSKLRSFWIVKEATNKETLRMRENIWKLLIWPEKCITKDT